MHNKIENMFPADNTMVGLPLVKDDLLWVQRCLTVI